MILPAHPGSYHVIYADPPWNEAGGGTSVTLGCSGYECDGIDVSKRA